MSNKREAARVETTTATPDMSTYCMEKGITVLATAQPTCRHGCTNGCGSVYLPLAASTSLRLRVRVLASSQYQQRRQSTGSYHAAVAPSQIPPETACRCGWRPPEPRTLVVSPNRAVAGSLPATWHGVCPTSEMPRCSGVSALQHRTATSQRPCAPLGLTVDEYVRVTRLEG